VVGAVLFVPVLAGRSGLASEQGVPVERKPARTGLTVSRAATKTMWFTQIDFGCIKWPPVRLRRKLLESLLRSDDCARPNGVLEGDMEKCHDKGK